MDKVVPVLIVAGLVIAVVAYVKQARRDARKRAEQAAADEFRAQHQDIIRSTL